jgi:hypothetical protein
VLGVVVGAVLGVGGPYLIMTFGGELSATVRMLGISLALAGGGWVARAGRPAAKTHLIETDTQRRLT